MEVDATGNVYVADAFNSPHSQCAADTTFSAISVGQTWSSQNVYLEINQTLPISSFNVPPPEGGTHEYADGTVTGCPTGSAIAAGTICTIPVTFSPTFLGVRGVPLIVATTSSGEFKFGLTGGRDRPADCAAARNHPNDGWQWEGPFSGANGPATATGMTTPPGVVRDSAGNLYIATDDNRIRNVDPGGTITTRSGCCLDAGSAGLLWRRVGMRRGRLLLADGTDLHDHRDRHERKPGSQYNRNPDCRIGGARNRRMRIFVNVLLLSLPLAAAAQQKPSTPSMRQPRSANCVLTRRSADAAASGWRAARANSPIRYVGTFRP